MHVIRRMRGVYLCPNDSHANYDYDYSHANYDYDYWSRDAEMGI